MNRKSITQEYYVLAVDKNGLPPTMHKEEFHAGLTAAGMMDLLLHDVITLEMKRILVRKELPETLKHLEPLYMYLDEKPRTADSMMLAFYTGGKIKQLVDAVGSSLCEAGLASEEKGILFAPKKLYIPESAYKEELISHIKAAVKEEGKMQSCDAALICIMKEAKNLRQYFSKHEIEEVQIRLKELKENSLNQQLMETIRRMNDIMTVAFMAVFMLG